MYQYTKKVKFLSQSGFRKWEQKQDRHTHTEDKHNQSHYRTAFAGGNNNNKASDILTYGFAGIQSNFWHGWNTEITRECSDGLQLMVDDSLFFGNCEKRRQIAYQHKT